MDGQRITLPYIIGEHPDVKDRIVIAFDNTGLNLSNPDHKQFIDTLAKIVISQMYAKAHNLNTDNVKY